MAAHPEDLYAELWDERPCDVNADFDMIFATREEAEAAEKALSC